MHVTIAGISLVDSVCDSLASNTLQVIRAFALGLRGSVNVRPLALVYNHRTARGLSNRVLGNDSHWRDEEMKISAKINQLEAVAEFLLRRNVDYENFLMLRHFILSYHYILITW